VPQAYSPDLRVLCQEPYMPAALRSQPPTLLTVLCLRPCSLHTERSPCGVEQPIRPLLGHAQRCLWCVSGRWVRTARYPRPERGGIRAAPRPLLTWAGGQHAGPVGMPWTHQAGPAAGHDRRQYSATGDTTPPWRGSPLAHRPRARRGVAAGVVWLSASRPGILSMTVLLTSCYFWSLMYYAPSLHDLRSSQP
jgi:hypothetical protein